MAKKTSPIKIMPPKAPDFHVKKKYLKFPRRRYQPLPGVPEKVQTHIAAYAFIVILLCIFVLGIQFNSERFNRSFQGAAYSAETDAAENDYDYCLYVMEQQGGCSNICYGIPFDQEKLSIAYNPKCCGDDSMEHANYFKVYSTGDNAKNPYSVGLSSNSLDAACCQQETDCVYQAKCYSENTLLDLNGDGVKGEACSQGKWIDLDAYENLCYETPGMYWATSGEDHSFGEYETPYSTECCGDDAGEYRKGGVYCCDSPEDEVVGGKCA